MEMMTVPDQCLSCQLQQILFVLMPQISCTDVFSYQLQVLPIPICHRQSLQQYQHGAVLQLQAGQNL